MFNHRKIDAMQFHFVQVFMFQRFSSTLFTSRRQVVEEEKPYYTFLVCIITAPDHTRHREILRERSWPAYQWGEVSRWEGVYSLVHYARFFASFCIFRARVKTTSYTFLMVIRWKKVKE